MFIGTYYHTIDTKGRLIIPAKLRDELGEQFVVTRGLDGCLSIYAMDEWEALAAKIHALPLTSQKARQFSRFILAGAAECELDKMGRILLPQVLRQAAGLDKEVVLIGVGSRVEIWDRDKWTEANAFDDDEMAENLDGLEELGI